MSDLLASPGTLVDLALALGLGLLVGLQREWVDAGTAGIRTFPLLTLFGAVCALLAASHGGWILGAGALGVAAIVVVGDVGRLRRARARGEEPDPGITTEVATLLMFGVGALLPLGYRTPAVVLGATVALLLHWKRPLHDLVDRIGPGDVRAIMRLVLVALVILPLLPNRSLGPYEVLNPFEMWLMVVLIVGISLGAYVAYKLLGVRGGMLAAGLLGGLISSTATSVTYAQRTRDDVDRVPSATLVVLLASAVAFARVLGEVAVVAPTVFWAVAGPISAMMAWCACVGGIAYLWGRREFARESEVAERDPPSTLGAAIVFGILYGVVLLGVAFAREHFGQEGLYVVAGLSGLTDMDAITLSTAQLMRRGGLEVSTGWRLVLLGGLANFLFKGAVVAVLGHRRLAARVALLFGAALAGGVLILLFWPGG